MPPRSKYCATRRRTSSWNVVSATKVNFEGGTASDVRQPWVACDGRGPARLGACGRGCIMSCFSRSVVTAGGRGTGSCMHLRVVGSLGFQTAVLQAAAVAGFDVATALGSRRVDRTIVGMVSQAEVNAGTASGRRKSALSEVARHQRLRDVGTLLAPPAKQVVCTHQNAAVGRITATGTTLPAVELIYGFGGQSEPIAPQAVRRADSGRRENVLARRTCLPQRACCAVVPAPRGLREGAGPDGPRSRPEHGTFFPSDRAVSRHGSHFGIGTWHEGGLTAVGFRSTVQARAGNRRARWCGAFRGQPRRLVRSPVA